MSVAIEQKNIKPASGRGGKYLTFVLGREEYALEILKVREIIGYMDITPVPRTPPHIKGVINLRGQVIAVVDLRARFAMEQIARTEQTCIVVVEIQGADRKIITGIVVDRVSEVITINEKDTEDAPAMGASVDTAFVLGMGKVGKSVMILLDIDKVLSQADVAAVASEIQQ